MVTCRMLESMVSTAMNQSRKYGNTDTPWWKVRLLLGYTTHSYDNAASKLLTQTWHSYLHFTQGQIPLL